MKPGCNIVTVTPLDEHPIAREPEGTQTAYEVWFFMAHNVDATRGVYLNKEESFDFHVYTPPAPDLNLKDLLCRPPS